MAEPGAKRALTGTERARKARDCAAAVKLALAEDDRPNAEQHILRTFHEGVSALELHAALNEAGIE